MNDEPKDEITRVPPELRRGGAWVVLGLDEYRIPPLAFGDIQDLQDSLPLLAKINGVPTKEQMGVVNNIVYRAMRRNYPTITEQQVTDMLDVKNFQDVLMAVLNTSGFRRAEPGEAVTASPSTGTSST